MNFIDQILLLIVVAIVVSVASAWGFWIWVAPMQIHIVLKVIGAIIVLLFSFKILALALGFIGLVGGFILGIVRDLFELLMVVVWWILEALAGIPTMFKKMRSRIRS